MAADLPEQIGKYQILRLIGRGGMGVLYHARDTEKGREVALKVMSSQSVEDAESRARFQHEAQLAARLQHRNIVKVFEFGEDGDTPFIAMEYLRGATLSEHLTRGEPMPLRTKLDVVIQVCEGLQCLHEEGIVHRDIKPGNIWLLEDGSVKLLDLGIAKQADVQLTQYGSIVGSAEYMAPEQLSGLPVDGRADIFSAGVVLYELLSGQKPFRAASITAVMMKVLHEPVPDIRTYVPHASEALAQALETALRKDPADRYPHAEEFASDLRLARDAGEWTSDDTAAGSRVQAADLLSADQTVLFEPDAAKLPPMIDPSIRPASEIAAPRAAVAVPVPPRPASRIGLWSAAALVVVAAGAAVFFFGYRGAGSGADDAYVLDVRSTPPGAEISVDGAVTGRRTPAVVEFAARPARIGLALPGYETITAPLANTTERRMNLDYNLKRLLQVHSEPSGARVFVDGRDTGLVTPATLPLGEPLPAAVELQLAGHRTASEPVTSAVLGAGLLTMRLVAERDVNPGPDRDKVPKPVALVTVTLSGSYPFTVSGCNTSSQPSQNHILKVASPCVLRLLAPEYLLDANRPIAAASGQVELTAPPLVSVQLRSRHQDCTLEIAGRAVGSPPADVEIAAGTYTAMLRCPDGRTMETRSFAIEPGQSSRRVDDYLR